jgi:hypothetical protein
VNCPCGKEPWLCCSFCSYDCDDREMSCMKILYDDSSPLPDESILNFLMIYAKQGIVNKNLNTNNNGQCFVTDSKTKMCSFKEFYRTNRRSHHYLENQNASKKYSSEMWPRTQQNSIVFVVTFLTDIAYRIRVITRKPYHTVPHMFHRRLEVSLMGPTTNRQGHEEARKREMLSMI